VSRLTCAPGSAGPSDLPPPDHSCCLASLAWRLADDPVVVSLILDLRRAAGEVAFPLACLVSLLALSSLDPQGSIYAAGDLRVWGVWESGATGGADAKIIITLVLGSSPDGLLFIPGLSWLAGIQGLFGLIAKRKPFPSMGLTWERLACCGLTAGH